jgi:hypothetical protein
MRRMTETRPGPLGNVITIDDERIKSSSRLDCATLSVMSAAGQLARSLRAQSADQGR